MTTTVWETCTDVRTEIGEERYLRQISQDCWISVFYRRTGFGWYEWETAIVFCHSVREGDPSWKTRDLLIIAGDRRDELETMPEDQLREWYKDHIEGNRNSLDTLIEAARKAVLP